MALTFFSPQFLWLLAALPLVVALHYLRARRTQHDVSALFLWERARQAVAKRRRFSPTWLLLAQLAFTALAAVVMARPALVAAAEPDRVIIIDASASMAARSAESPTARSRLDVAKEIAAELGVGSGRLALIRAGNEATLALPLDASEADREAALQQLVAGDAGADLGGALGLAAALLPGAEVHLLSDQELEVGQASVHVVGEPVTNVGITALDIGIGQVFVGLVASGDGPVETGIALYRDGEELASGTVLVPANGAGSITFPLLEMAGILEARVVSQAADALALDDVAYAGSRSVSVVTDDGHGAITRAIAAVPNTEVRYSIGARLLEADLKVLTTGTGADSEPGNYLVVEPPAQEPIYAVVSDWDRAEPLLRFVDLSELVVGLHPDGTGWQEDPEWRVLARTADLTPVMRVRDTRDSFELQLAFHPSQSDLTLRPAFPALAANVVERIRTTTRVRLGEPLPGSFEGDAPDRLLEPGIYGPGGATAQVAPQTGPDGQGDPAPGGGDLGPAQAAAASGAAPVVLASLLSAGESRLPRTGELQIGQAPEGAPGTAPDDVSVPQEADDPATAVDAAAAEPAASADGMAVPGAQAQTTIGTVLLVLALLTLLAEWLLYSGALDAVARRLGVRLSAAGQSGS